MISNKILERFSFDAETLDEQLFSRLTIWEVFALGFALSMVGIFAWLNYLGYWEAHDYKVYMLSAHGDFSINYHPYWIVPLFMILDTLPWPAGFALFGLANIIGVFLGTRIFGGHTPLTLLSYQMLYVLGYGNIVGILIGGLAVFWWALAHKRWHLAGAGLILASTKYQIGLSIGIFLFLMAEISWQSRLKVLVVPLIVTAFSLTLYPLWPLDLVEALQRYPPDDKGSITLWKWIGPAALLFWLPPLLIPLSKTKRLIALAATTALAIPYFQQTDLLALFMLPVGFLTLLGNLGYLFWFYQWQAMQLLTIVPLSIYAIILIPALYRWICYRNQPSKKKIL